MTLNKIVSAALGLGMIASVAGSDVNKTYSNLADYVVGTAHASDSTISMSEIKSLMSRASVDDILREEYASGAIQKITYNKGTKKTDFDEKVYQVNLNPSERKPVLVMYHNNKDKPSKRESIVFRELTEKYNNKINFISYDVGVQPDFSKGVFMNNLGREVKKEKIKMIPSIGMYSQFDLVRGETPDKNDGDIKQIDVLNGGPEKDKSISAVIQNMSVMIDNSIFQKYLPNIYRFENQYQLHKLNK